MLARLHQRILILVGLMLCCLVSAQAMESYERNQERLKAATFSFIENYVNSKNDRPRMYMVIPSCLLQYVPERLTREFSPHDQCLINVATIEEIAAAIGINAAIKNFAAEYEAFQESNLATKRINVSNYLFGCVFDVERESIVLKGQSRIGEDKADQIARFFKIIT